VYPRNKVPCIDWNGTHSAQSSLQKLPFNYLLCNYFPLSSNEVPEGTIFIPTSVQTESDPQTCQTLFGITPPTQEEVETDRHLTTSELVNAERIIFAYNENDPTTAVGIEQFPVSQLKDAALWMLTSGSAHGEESFASYADDHESVVNVSGTLRAEWRTQSC
jgi:dipeptidyl-peptidase II